MIQKRSENNPKTIQKLSKSTFIFGKFFWLIYFLSRSKFGIIWINNFVNNTFQPQNLFQPQNVSTAKFFILRYSGRQYNEDDFDRIDLYFPQIRSFEVNKEKLLTHFSCLCVSMCCLKAW